MCCGQKRSALRSITFPPTTSNPARHQTQSPVARRLQMAYSAPDRGIAATANSVSRGALVPEPERSPVALRYVRTAPLRVVGEASRQRYEFSASAPIQPVDPRDLFQLLSMGYFSRA